MATLLSQLSTLAGGSTLDLKVNGRPFHVRYDERQSHGDNGSKVPGATIGEYTVTHPDGRHSEHEHGPHATNETARKRGANPNAKFYAAEQALQAITASAFKAERRTP